MANNNILWEGEDKANPGVVCEAEYFPDTKEYEVRAKRGDQMESERFTADYEPRFGIDVSDMTSIMNLAEQLSDKIMATDKRPDWKQGDPV